MTQHQLVRFDTTALNRALVGFDQFFGDFDSRFANQIQQNYPPHNIIKHDDDNYEIQIAIAGFKKDEIELTTQNNHLVVTGTKESDSASGEFIHKGISARNFERFFRLEGFLEVKSADITDGVLIIKLTRNIPEEKKPKKILIKSS